MVPTTPTITVTHFHEHPTALPWTPTSTTTATPTPYTAAAPTLASPPAPLKPRQNSRVGDQAVHCTGDAANDTEALATANAASVEGSAVIIHGSCLISQTLVLRSGRTYLGEGRASTGIDQAPGANLPALVASDSWVNNSTYTGAPVRLAHLSINGRKGSNPLGGPTLVLRSWDTIVEDVQITNSPSDGIRVTSVGSGGSSLTTSQVNGRISNVFVEGSVGDGIRVEESSSSNSCTDWNLLDSWIAGSGKSAINMDNSAGWQICGNHVYGVRRHAIFASNCFGTTVSNSRTARRRLHNQFKFLWHS